MKKTVAFCTLGCKVNQYETDAMRGSFEAEGYEVKEFSQEASVYVINTCTVTNMADRKSRQMMHRAKKKNPDGIIVAVGCYVQAAKEQLEDLNLSIKQCSDFKLHKQANIRRETYTSQLMKGGHFTMNLPLFISSANFLLMKSLLLVLFRGLCSLLRLTAQQKIN